VSSETTTQADSRTDVAAPPIDAVVTHHTDGFRSGVARFNELLAEHLDVPLLRVFDVGVEQARNALLSFKVGEMPDGDRAALQELVRRIDWRGELFLHEFDDLPLERELVSRARRVHCGNLEIENRVRRLTARVETAWTPGLILDHRVYQPAQVSVFSFGMAHKIQADRFRRLKELLDASGRTYAVYVSAANHETASLRDAQIVFEEMHEIFPHLYFLGNLSDVAVHNQLLQTTFFAAFFPRGVRANNTSVAAALELGAVVITNLDRHSPREFVHMDNLVDLERCDELPTDPLTLKRLSVRAMETGRGRGWQALVARLRS
jgi:hypothetical protein